MTPALAEPAAVQQPVSADPRPLRIWVDMTNSPHVVIFRPLITRMIARGHEVTVTARDFAQTLGLLERYGIPHTVFGAHGGAGRAGKARAMASRTSALTRFARRERFDVAIAHGSTDQPPAAYAAGTPQVTMFDYEYATVMHHWNGRFATRVARTQRHSRVGALAVRYPRTEARSLSGAQGGVLPCRPRVRSGCDGRARP